MTWRWRSRAVALAIAAGCFAGVGLACAGDDGGRDLAAGWRGLLTIRGAALGEEIALAQAAYAEAIFAGTLASRQLSETSGLTTSRRRDDLLWAINDSGKAPRLHAVGTDGSDRGRVTLAGVSAVDWEDIASFELDGKAYLLVADTGDNMSWRKRVELLVVEEPKLSGDRVATDTVTRPAWRIRFSFEDGPRDCEAVAVDGERQRILLISKRNEPPGLYELPLVPADRAATLLPEAATLVAKRIGDVPGIPPPTEADVGAARWLGRYFAMPTALDLSTDGRSAVVLTYREAYLFERTASEAWEVALGRAPQRIAMPAMAQAESIAFARDGRTIFATSEGLSAPLYRLERIGAPATFSLRRERSRSLR